jgi:tetratricopeptide (TPR) repeat protein
VLLISLEMRSTFFRRLLLLGLLVSGSPLAADEIRPPAPELPQRLSRLEGFQSELDDDPLSTFEPRETPGPQAEKKREALSWYMLGNLHQGREQSSQALGAYLKAIEADPGAIDAYRAAIPLLIQERQEERARQLALQSALHGEAGIELVQAVAALYTRDNKVDTAIELVQAARRLPSVTPGSLRALELRRDLGLYLRLKEDFEGAADAYAEVFEALRSGRLSAEEQKRLARDAGATFDEFGDTFLKAQRPEMALLAYEEAAKYRDARPGLHSYNLATVFRQTKQPEKALEELDKYLTTQLQNRGRQAYQLLKELLQDLNRSDELFARLEKLHQDDPHNETLRFFYADELVLANRLEEAEKLYLADRTEAEINAPQAVVGLLSIHRLRKDIPRLYTAIVRAYPIVPRAKDAGVIANLSDDLKVLAERFDAELEALFADAETVTALFQHARDVPRSENPQEEFVRSYVLGKLATEADRAPEAIEFYNRAIATRNDPPDLLFRELASYLIDSKHHREAVDVLNEALRHPSVALRGSHWMFKFLQSYAFEYLGETENALQVIREAQQLQPNMPLLHFQEGWVVYHRQRWEAALQQFNKVIERFPGDKKMVRDCQFLISNIYVKLDKMDQGVQVLLDILAEDPDHPQANNDLGYLWADQNKNLDKAYEMIAKALAKEPENAAYLDSMGWVLYRQGKYAEAIEYLERATRQKRGEDAVLFDHYGDCLLKLDRREEAIRAFQKALQLEQEKELQDEELIQKVREKLAELGN